MRPAADGRAGPFRFRKEHVAVLFNLPVYDSDSEACGHMSLHASHGVLYHDVNVKTVCSICISRLADGHGEELDPGRKKYTVTVTFICPELAERPGAQWARAVGSQCPHLPLAFKFPSRFIARPPVKP